MFCVYCNYRDTKVINSRPNKKRPLVWRRRQCLSCDRIITTPEIPATDDNIKIYNDSEAPTAFSVPRLAFSLTQSLSGVDSPSETAFWLAQTVYETVLTLNTPLLSSQQLATHTHAILKRYDKRSALHYAMRYSLES